MHFVFREDYVFLGRVRTISSGVGRCKKGGRVGGGGGHTDK